MGWEDRAPDVVVGTLQDTAALAQLMDGAQAVINAAGLIKARRRSDFFEVNEHGARRVAIAAGERRFIHVSSLAAREPGLSDYAASKRAGEEAIQAISSPSATIVRPPAIYGPGDRETLALFKAAHGPVVFAPGSSRTRVAIAEVDDVSHVIVDLLDVKSAVLAVTVAGDRPGGYGWREIIATAARAVGGRPLVVATPPMLLKAAGAASHLLAGWRDEIPIFTLGKAREALHPDWRVSAAEQGPTVNHVYRGLEDGFARTVSWYRRHGWLR
jgi:uncharacterized protein YbjT (DUF2867 family)